MKSIRADNTDIHIGLKIKELRLLKGMSRIRLAAKIGATHQQLQKYESATNRISSGRLLRIANALTVSVNIFFEGLQDDLPFPNPYERMTLEVSKNFSRIKNHDLQISINQLVKTAADMK